MVRGREEKRGETCYHISLNTTRQKYFHPTLQFNSPRITILVLTPFSLLRQQVYTLYFHDVSMYVSHSHLPFFFFFSVQSDFLSSCKVTLLREKNLTSIYFIQIYVDYNFQKKRFSPYIGTSSPVPESNYIPSGVRMTSGVILVAPDLTHHTPTNLIDSSRLDNGSVGSGLSKMKLTITGTGSKRNKTSISSQ